MHASFGSHRRRDILLSRRRWRHLCFCKASNGKCELPLVWRQSLKEIWTYFNDNKTAYMTYHVPDTCISYKSIWRFWLLMDGLLASHGRASSCPWQRLHIHVLLVGILDKTRLSTDATFSKTNCHVLRFTSDSVCIPRSWNSSNSIAQYRIANKVREPHEFGTHIQKSPSGTLPTVVKGFTRENELSAVYQINRVLWPGALTSSPNIPCWRIRRHTPLQSQQRGPYHSGFGIVEGALCHVFTKSTCLT
jgi:hypothetical protein